MARALIVACGCHGRRLGAELRDRGWQVRGTSRTEAGAAEIEAAGFAGAVANPDRPGTIVDLVGDVAVVVWLLGSAAGGADEIAAMHGPRLEHLLATLVDTPVRGFAYEGVGTVAREVLETGWGALGRAAQTWRIPVCVLEDQREHRQWPAATADRIASLLGVPAA